MGRAVVMLALKRKSWHVGFELQSLCKFPYLEFCDRSKCLGPHCGYLFPDETLLWSIYESKVGKEEDSTLIKNGEG